MNDARQLLDRQISEREFQEQVIQLASLCGWRCHHHYDSRRSEPGWPDLVCVSETDWSRPRLFLELKAQNGRLSKAQQFWIEALDCGEELEEFIIVRVFRPSDLDEIEALLSGQKRERSDS